MEVTHCLFSILHSSLSPAPIYERGGGGGGLSACIISSPRNVSCAVSFFSRGFSWGFDKRYEFIPNESLYPCVELVDKGFWVSYWNKRKQKKNKDYRSYSTLSYFEIENSSFSFIYFGTTKPLTECRLNFQNNFCGEGFRQYWMT